MENKSFKYKPEKMFSIFEKTISTNGYEFTSNSHLNESIEIEVDENGDLNVLIIEKKAKEKK